jgi:hypothetical protein
LVDVGGCHCALRNVDIQGQGGDLAQGFERLLPGARLIESFEQMGATRLTVAAGKAAQRRKRHFVRRSSKVLERWTSSRIKLGRWPPLYAAAIALRSDSSIANKRLACGRNFAVVDDVPYSLGSVHYGVRYGLATMHSGHRFAVQFFNGGQVFDR